MNEQRQQAYFNLIQSLLNCRTNNEILEIFAANQDLLDAGFLQALEAVAQMFSQQGDENRANWLRNLAMQLREALNLDKKVELQSLSEEEKQAYYQFLMQVLEATGDSRGNSQVVYPLLEKNIDKLNGVFKEVLHRRGTNFLEELKVDEAKYLYIAAIIVIFSNLIARFPLGNKASNMEIAITGYKVALTVYSQQAFPDQWAATQNHLANAYLDRIAGERAENLEQAPTIKGVSR